MAYPSPSNVNIFLSSRSKKKLRRILWNRAGFCFHWSYRTINKWQYVIIERQDGDKVCIANRFHGSGWGGDVIIDHRYSDENQEYLHKFPEYFRDKIEEFCSEYGIPIIDVSGKIRYKPSSRKSIVITSIIGIGFFIALSAYSLYTMKWLFAFNGTFRSYRWYI